MLAPQLEPHRDHSDQHPATHSATPAGALQSDSTTEDVKGAAALALGGVAVGNLGAYLPALLTAVRGAVSPLRAPRIASAAKAEE